MSRPRILFVYSRPASFVEIDRRILAEEYEVEEWAQPGRVPDLRRLIGALRRSDAVFGWFASWHTFFPITLAWLMGKPSVQIVGGFDTANMPDIGFGYQQGGLRRHASRWIMRRAGRLVTNSEYSRSEIAANTPIDPARVTVVRHGVPDPFGALGGSEREPLALTVGPIDQGTLVQKGHLAFVRAAHHLPDVQFVHVGKALDDAIDTLRAESPPNVRHTGWLSDDELEGLYARAGAYVQASLHEGFGLAVAEAMLAGCVPVVMDVTAMPEVVDGAGVLIDSQDGEVVAAGVRQALDSGAAGSAGARRRILEEFPMEGRREGILAVTREALAAGGVPS